MCESRSENYIKHKKRSTCGNNVKVRYAETALEIGKTSPLTNSIQTDAILQPRPPQPLYMRRRCSALSPCHIITFLTATFLVLVQISVPLLGLFTFRSTSAL